MGINIVAAAFAAIVVSVISAAAAPTPAEKCEGGKNDASGKYAACMAKAEKTLLFSSSLDSYDSAILNCAGKYSGSWSKLESPGACPTTNDGSSIQAFVDACVQTVAVALGGGGLGQDPVTCNAALGACTGNLSTCDGDLVACFADLSTTNSDLGVCNGGLGACTGQLGICNGGLATCNGNLATCNSNLGVCNAGTAAAGNVLSGMTFSSVSGLGLSGTMPNNGAVSLIPTTTDQSIAAGYHNGSGKCAGDADLTAVNVLRSVNLFGVVGTLPPARPAKTGQTTCYDTGGSPITCFGSNHDGDLQKGVARSFTDNGNGTVTDNATGLMWEKLSDDGGIHDKDTAHTWPNALAAKVATLNSAVFAGYADWRLPNRFELETLLNLEVVNPSTYSDFNAGCVGGCTVLTCSCTSSDGYWSSTSYKDSPSSAWGVSFLTGDPFSFYKTASYPVRAVRGGA